MRACLRYSKTSVVSFRRIRLLFLFSLLQGDLIVVLRLLDKEDLFHYPESFELLFENYYENEVHYTMKKDSINQEGVTILKIIYTDF